MIIDHSKIKKQPTVQFYGGLMIMDTVQILLPLFFLL